MSTVGPGAKNSPETVKLIQNTRTTSNKNVQQGRQNYDQQNSTNKKDEEAGVFEKRGDVRLGSQNDYAFINELNSTSFSSCKKIEQIPLIGIWGVVKKNRLSLKKIAQLVYGDESLARFIKDANGVGEYVPAGKELYIPNITINSTLDLGQKKCSRYSLTKFDLWANKGIKAKGDVFVGMDEGIVTEYYYMGKDHKSSELFTDPISVTFKTYTAKCHKIVNDLNKSLELIDKYNAADFACAKEDIVKAYFTDYYCVEKKIGKNNRWIYKVSKSAKIYTEDLEKTYGWVSKAEFAQRFYAANEAKGNLCTTVIFAGVSTVIDWNENHNVNHAICTFGREVTKGVISYYAGIGAVALALAFFPGLGWVALAIIFVAASLFVSFGLDALDKWLEDGDIYPAWAKLNKSIEITA